MKKELRKALLEIKEKKDTLVLESKIAEKRIMMILENEENLHNFKKIPFEKRFKMSCQLLQEFAYLQQNTLILEQGGIADFLKNIFGGNIFKNIFSGSIETFAEPILNSILGKFGFKSEGILKKFIISFLTTNPSRLVGALSDCRELTKLVAESLVEGVVMLIQDQTNTNSTAYNFVRNMLGGVAKDVSIINSIEEKIGDTICGFFDEYSEKAKGILDKLKPSES